MKKLTLALVGIALAFSLVGCSSVKSTVKENEESQEQEDDREDRETRETREDRETRAARETREEEEEPEEEPAEESVEEPVQGTGITAQGGYGEGRMGDTMKTYFFDYTINSAYLCDEFNGYVPAEGNRLLVAEATVKNTFNESIIMYDTDFQVQWNSTGEDDYDFPITFYADPVSDEQLPAEYELGINKDRTGLLVFEIPGDKKDFSISYLELFDDDSEGNVFFVFFTAEEGSGE